MSVAVVSLNRHHVHALFAFDEVRKIHPIPTDFDLEHMESCGWTILDNGRVIACAGLVKVWENRYEAWVIFAPGPYAFLKSFRKIKRVLDGVDIKRVEAWTLADFWKGHFLLRMLGFKLEAKKMQAFTPDGKAASLYARVKHD